MSKIYFNKKVNPAITKAKDLPKINTQRVFFSSPLADSVERLEKQNEEALNALTKLNGLVAQLAKSDKLDDISSNQQALLENYGAIQTQMMAQFNSLKVAQEEIKEQQDGNRVQLDQLHQEIQSGSSEVSELKETIKNEQLGAQLQQLLNAINELEKKEEEGVTSILENNALQTLQLEEITRKQAELKKNEEEGITTVLENNALQTLLLEEITSKLAELKKKGEEGTTTILENNALQTLILEEISRKQAEFGTNQADGLTTLVKNLNLILSENERSHDTQLQNQKLLVDSLYKLANQQYGIELYME